MHRLIAVVLVLALGAGIGLAIQKPAISRPVETPDIAFLPAGGRQAVKAGTDRAVGTWLRPAETCPQLKSHPLPPTDAGLWFAWDNDNGTWIGDIISDVLWPGAAYDDDGGMGTVDSVAAYVVNVEAVPLDFFFVLFDDDGTGLPNNLIWAQSTLNTVPAGADLLVSVPTTPGVPGGIAVTGKFHVFLVGISSTPLWIVLDDNGRQAPWLSQWIIDNGTLYEINWNVPGGADMFIRAYFTPTSDDIAVTSFERPCYFGEMPMSFKPKFEIWNRGDNAQNNFDVKCEISTVPDGVVYSQTVTVTTELASRETRSIEFPAWANPPEGDYSVTFTSLLADDDPTNDTKTNEFPVSYELEARWDNTDLNEWAYARENDGEGLLNAFPNYWGRVEVTELKVGIVDWWPTPGGDQYKVAVQDNDGTDGGPGTVLYASGTLTATLGDWNTSTVPPGLVIADDVFYIKYTQVGDYPDCAGVAGDVERDGPPWSQWAEGPVGNYGTTDDNDFGIRCRIHWLPTWTAGWQELKPMPAAPTSERAPKDGAWLASMRDMTDGLPVFYVAKGNKTTDFYMFDPSEGDSGRWYDRLAIPGDEGTKTKLPSKGCVGVSDGARYLYMTKGNNTLGFWRYDALTNTWSNMSGVGVPEGKYRKRVKGGTDMVYATYKDTGCVYLLKGYKTEFYRFNPLAARWDTLPEVPYGGTKQKYDKGSFLAHDGENTIYAHQAKYYDKTNTVDPHHWMFRYDIVGDTWYSGSRRGMPILCLEGGRENKKKKSSDGAAGVWFDGGMYALKGGNTQGFYKYLPGTDNWVQLETVPGNGSSPKKKRVKSGGDIAGNGYGDFFVLKGNKSYELWRYTLASAFAGAPVPDQGVMAGLARTDRFGMTVAPNPVASGFAVLRFNLPEAGPVALTVFDVGGRAVLHSAYSARPGVSGVQLDLRDLAAGVYLVRLDADRCSATRKLVVQH